MPSGVPKDWTLEELEFIWTFDGSDGTTVREHAARMGIAFPTWYSTAARLREEGGPENLYRVMQESKTRRYNQKGVRKTRPVSEGKLDTQRGQVPFTLEQFLNYKYSININHAGRGGRYDQYKVTIPPPLAEAMLKLSDSFKWEIKPNGILLVPVKEDK